MIASGFALPTTVLHRWIADIDGTADVNLGDFDITFMDGSSSSCTYTSITPDPTTQFNSFEYDATNIP